MTDEQKKEKEQEEKKAPVAEAPAAEPAVFNFDDDDVLSSDVFGGDEELPKKKKQDASAPTTGKRKIRAKKKKTQRQIVRGAVHIQATYNNTIVTFADQAGNALSWSSAGKIGFKGPKKSTPYAATLVVRDASTPAREQYGMREVDIFVSGIGPGRDAAVRAISGNGLVVHIIKDMTPVPHNGCRPAKVRRV